MTNQDGQKCVRAPALHLYASGEERSRSRAAAFEPG